MLVAGWGLAVPPPDQVVVGGDDAAELVGWLHRERLTGVAWDALDADALVLDGAAREHLAELHTEALGLTVVAEATALWVVELLAQHGIDAWLMKGLAAAHLDVPEPGWRTTSDVDLLVARDHLAGAVAALEHAGARRAEPPLAPWWERRYARAVVLRTADGVELDVHAAVAEGYFGRRLDHGALLSPAGDEYWLGGVAVRGLHPTARLVASCYGWVLGRGGGVRLQRDTVSQLRHPACDWRGAVALCARGDGEAVLARGLRAAHETVGVTLPDDVEAWAAGVRTSRRAGRALHLAERAERLGWAADARSTLMALALHDRPGYVAGVLWPPAASLRQRGRTRIEHLRRLVGRA